MQKNELSQLGRCPGASLLIGDINEENKIKLTGWTSFLRDIKPS